MRRVLGFVSWFLLVPYFAVRSNTPLTWFPGVRAIESRSNAQGAVALLVFFIILGVLSLTGEDYFIGNVAAYWVGILGVVPTMLAVAFLLNGEREKRYWS